MSNICEKCGLPRELCVCETIAKEDQRIKVHKVKRRFGKTITIIEGFDNDIDIKEISKKLKNKLACGGTAKDGKIELQGNHISKVKEELVNLGFNKNSIDTQ